MTKYKIFFLVFFSFSTLNIFITSKKLDSKIFNSYENPIILKENNINDEIILNPDVKYSSGFIASAPTYFRIKLDNIQNIKNLNIYFTVISGNADMYIYSDNEHKNLIEKKNFRYVYKKEIIEITEDFLENYYISIILHESSYIEIKYDINNEKEYILGNNEVNIEYLNKEEDYKTYIINSEFENNYFLIQSLDCSFSFKYGETEEKNITYKFYEFSKDYKFNLKLENYFHTVINNKEDCSIFITVVTNSNSQNNHIIIPESIHNPSSLINTYYTFPFFYDDSFKGIFINIEINSQSVMESSSSPDLKISFLNGEEQSDIETYTIKKSKLFFIGSNIEKYCRKKNDKCILQIKLEKMDSSLQTNSYKIITTIQLSSLSPVYITKNQLYNEKILPLGSKYFYTQIDENEEGEINIMFNKGSGKIFAKIVEKNIFEKNSNWNRRISLPEENSDNLLDFDSIRGSLKYYSNNKYNNCSNGCELYILVKGKETIEGENMFNDFSFSIDKKRKDIDQNGVVNLLLNNFIKGNFTKNIYKYYTFTIYFDIKKISINYYSRYGVVYIKLGKGHIADKQNFDWQLIRKSDSDNRLIISSDDEKIGKDSLKNISFSIGIIPPDSYMKLREDILNDYYFLQVQTLYNDLSNYYYLNSEKSILCNTGANEFCYIFIPLSKLNNNKNTLIYASSTTNEENNINILANFYSEEEFDNISYDQSILDKFPKKEKSDQNSNNEKYLLLDNNKIIDNNFILLTIFTNEKNSLIKIILSPSSFLEKTSLPPFTERLIWINPNQKINFTILDNIQISKKYTLNIQTLKGVTELILGQNDYYSEMNGNYINEISPDFETPIQINNKNNNEPGAMIITYSKSEDNLKEFNLMKNINNEISFPLSKFPSRQIGFFELRKKSIKVNIYFYDIQFKEYSRSYVDKNLFDVYTMIIPDSGETFDLYGSYLVFERVATVDLMLNSGELVEGNNFVYNFIDKNYKNENDYKKIKEQITISEINDKNEIIIFPKSKYFYSLNENYDNKVNLILTNKVKDNKIILIDIVENIPVSNNLNYILKKNDDSIIDNYSKYDYMGKKRIIVDISDYEDKTIKLTIEKTNNDSISKNFTLQYYSLQDNSPIVEYKDFDNSFTISESEKKNLTSLIINFKNILHYYNTSISNVVYFIEVYNKTEDFNSYDKINTAFLGDGKNKNKLYGTNIDWLSYDYENYSHRVSRSELDIEDINSCLVRIVVNFINDKGFEERVIYKIKEEEKKEEENSYRVFIYFSIALVIISVIIILIFCIKNNKDKNNTSKLNNDKIEPISNLEDSKTEDLIEENKEN